MANRRLQIQPHLLTEDQVRQLSASQCAAFSEEIDQLLVATLQSIDANFAKATRTITDTILPAVENYGESSREIWQSVKFWKTFFEVAAGIKLVDPSAPRDESFSEDIQDRSDVTVQGNEMPQTPKSGDASLDSPEQQVSVTSSVPSMPGGRRMRMQDLSFDSPDVLRPDLETLSLGDIGASKGKARQEPPTPTRPPFSSRRSLGRKSLGPVASTPARSARFSMPVPQDWDGLADLTKTPLSAYKSPAPPSSKSFLFGQDTDADLSPPSMAYPFSALKGKITRTPGTEAAKMVTRDVLETAALRTGTRFQPSDLLDSPIVEPPSVMKNWHTRNYGDVLDKDRPAPPQFGSAPGSSSSRKSDDLIHLEEEGNSVIEHSLEEDDQEGIPPAEWAVDGSFAFEGQSGSFRDGLGEEELSFEGDDMDDDREEEPEHEQEAPDTLFGGVRRRSQDGLNKLEKFLKGQRIEETLHGGKLLESQPFERSPLAGRDKMHGL